jgi:hypothetical protein
MRKRRTLLEHQARCPLKSPPGRLIYTSPPGTGPAAVTPQISMWEVDGAENKVREMSLCTHCSPLLCPTSSFFFSFFYVHMLLDHNSPSFPPLLTLYFFLTLFLV